MRFALSFRLQAGRSSASVGSARPFSKPVGIGGLAGQGKIGLPNGIMGLYPASGEVELFGQPLKLNDPKAALGSGMAMVSIQMQWGLVGEAIDYNEHITGKRTEGSIYGTFNLSRRIGQTVGLGISFFALDWIGYQPTWDTQSVGTIFGFKILCVLIPAMFILGSWAAFKFVWSITPEIRAAMNAKKAEEAEK